MVLKANKIPEGAGVQHFPGAQLFPGRIQLLIPIETYRTCDFPGGGDPCLPYPLDPRMENCVIMVYNVLKLQWTVANSVIFPHCSFHAGCSFILSSADFFQHQRF